jgi:hypothetical protein
MWLVTFSPVASEPAGGGDRKGSAPEAAPQPFWVWADEGGNFGREGVRPGRYRLELVHKRNAPDTGGQWIEVPSESRQLGEVEIRAWEMVYYKEAR